MKKDTLNQTFKHLRENIAMTDAEKDRVLSVLKEHAALNTSAVESPLFATRSPFTAAGAWFGRFAAIAVIMVVITGSGIVAVANEALPGETLYGFKINVNEEIQSFLRPSSPAAQLAYEAERTQQRIQEAQTLIEQGRFDQDAQEDVAKSLTKHSKTIDTQAKKAAIQEPEAYQAVSKDIQKQIATSVDVLVEAADKKEDATVKVSLESVLAVADSTVKSIESIDTVIALEAPEVTKGSDEGTKDTPEQKDPVNFDPAQYTYKHPEYLAFVATSAAESYESMLVAAPAPRAAAPTETSAATSSEDEKPAAITTEEATAESEKTPDETKTTTADEQPNLVTSESVVAAAPEPLEPVLVSPFAQDHDVAIQETLADLEAAHTELEALYAAETPGQETLDKLSTNVLVLARTAYDLLGLVLPDLATVFPYVTFDINVEGETAIQPRTNGVVPIQPIAQEETEAKQQKQTNPQKDTPTETTKTAE